jgi:hypothetical protein
VQHAVLMLLDEWSIDQSIALPFRESLFSCGLLLYICVVQNQLLLILFISSLVCCAHVSFFLSFFKKYPYIYIFSLPYSATCSVAPSAFAGEADRPRFSCGDAER